jgi:hypothetical protein
MKIRQKQDIECIKYFIPECMKDVFITENDTNMFLDYSEQGLHKDKVLTYKMDGFNALIQGKRWRGIHIHEMYENGVLEGTMPYLTLLGGYGALVRRKWWQFWKCSYIIKHEPIPRVIVDFLKKEMFQGVDADIIEECYLSII